MATTSASDADLLRMADLECWEVLRRHHLGRVGLIDHGAPMIFPVNYAVDGESVVFRTAPGTKLIAAGSARQAVFEVDEADETFEVGLSVMIHGRLHEVTDAAERERLARLPIRPWAPGDRDHFVRVLPRWISGRRIPLKPVPDGLAVDAG